MLSWVREKISEGRLRWQQSVQQQRNSTSPPPLPPPNIIDSPVSSPIGNSSGSIESDENFSSIQQPAAQISTHRPNTNLTLQLQPLKPNILRKDQGIEREFNSDQARSTNSNFNHQTSTSIVINRRANDSSVPYVNLRIFNCIGSKFTICAPLTLTFADIKRKVIAEFHARRQLLIPCYTKLNCMPGSSREQIEEQKLSCDNLDLVSRHYKLARISKLHDNFDEHRTLATANVQNNEELILINNTTTYSNAHTKNIPTLQTVTKPTAKTSTAKPAANFHLNYESESDSDDNAATNNAITQIEIDSATAHFEPKHMCGPNIVNIHELVLQSDVQYDIRKILISLAHACAYVIGSGPFATRIINMLKQRLIQRKQYEQDTQQCLIEMGFSRSKVQHALNIKNNVYAAALEWLIENQSPTNPLLSTEQSPASSFTSKFTNNTTVKDNIESLLEIIRIYCQRDLPPTTEMIQFIVGMGFDEHDAHEALKITKNHQSNACEWLVGDRSKINQNDRLDDDSPILAALLSSPHIQLSLSNPKIFIAYLSILEDYGSMSMWMNDSETSNVIGQVLRTYHEEKHIMAINQFSQTQI